MHDGERELRRLPYEAELPRAWMGAMPGLIRS